MAFYRKAIPSSAPRDYAAWEAAGLRWLAQATPAGGVRVVEVLEVGDRHLDLERFAPCQPTPAQAEDFGRGLAVTHGAGAGAYGMAPQGWTGPGFLGPADDPLPLPLDPTPSWGIFFGEQRIRHTVRLGRTRGLWAGSAGGVFEAVADRLGDGEFDDNQPPARLHGDLWSGNVLWTQAGAVLIDPAAHGGHRETDLAMLALFGAPPRAHHRGICGGLAARRRLAGAGGAAPTPPGDVACRAFRRWVCRSCGGHRPAVRVSAQIVGGSTRSAR